MAGVLTKLQNLVGGYDWEDVKQFCLNNVRTALVLGVSVTAFWLMFRKPRGIPPGPRFTLPILGDLLAMGDMADSDLRKPIRRLRKKYGDIFSMYMGQQLFICINGSDLIKDAFVKNGDMFSDRPSLYTNDAISLHKGIVFTSGQLWKDQRKFALETLREFGFGRSILEDKIQEEIAVYMEIISKENGKPYDFTRLTQAAVSNIISSLVYGQRFDYDNPRFKEYLELVETNFKDFDAAFFVNCIPFLRFLPGDIFKVKSIIRNVRRVEDIIAKPSIKEHEENFDENDTRDFISSYLKEMYRVKQTGEKSYMDKDNLLHSIGDLFVAGTETTSTTIMWTILYFLHHPDIQARCYKEVQDVVGSGRLPSLKDRDSMPYTQAVMHEVLRISNIIILGVPHSVKEDTVFRGYRIPKHAAIIANMDSVLADDTVWGDPDVFRPERFLDGKGQLVKREEFMPFSIGRRVCLGESLARMELFLFLTTLVQRFELRPVDPLNPPSLKGVFGITHAPAKYKVRALLRQ